ncbi:hypothetical protein TWF506_007555 [Arthrobotrys conoides]|uniref:Uncharacterized protein n=1 Tax=Arthrobotrys conoides TaxID=74498 RepID=A0AAN8NET4_9PEZI
MPSKIERIEGRISGDSGACTATHLGTPKIFHATSNSNIPHPPQPSFFEPLHPDKTETVIGT